MFKVAQTGMNRLDIELSGKLNSEEMQVALDELVSKSKKIEKGKMLYDEPLAKVNETWVY